MYQQSTAQLHEHFRYRVDRVGQEGEPVLVIDNFLTNAESLVNYVIRFGQFQLAGPGYPGVRSPAPDKYLVALRQLLGDLIYRTFDLDEQDITGAQADFSMVMTPPQHLRLPHRIPHYDSNKRAELAAVHFLCSGPQGSTAFYRHRQTGYEFVDHSRLAHYRATLEAEVKQQGDLPARYMNGSTPLFEQIAEYGALFNRILIYPCTSLHSGNIPEDFVFDADPRRGRLSINTFIFCRD
ncbi:DUF6445 family protein [Cellvibrio sp. ARAG 10.3]|uniref:DUF6445 family protein n=1 Tax=Cellvibrio sp. ARAG 10.3 TaxID=3451358 RepID=UPI003F463C54